MVRRGVPPGRSDEECTDCFTRDERTRWHAAEDTQPGPQPKSPITASEVADDTLTKSASLLRRLAEAADGFRDGEPHWVAIHRKGQQGHHKVLGVFKSFDEARDVVQKEGLEYAVFGPFVTVDDPPDQSSSAEDVVEVIVKQKNGVEKRFSPDSVDALFWSLAAFDKFIAPYLTSVDGSAVCRGTAGAVPDRQVSPCVLDGSCSQDWVVLVRGFGYQGLKTRVTPERTKEGIHAQVGPQPRIGLQVTLE